MFGYVRPSDRAAVGAGDGRRFRAAYCGLCHALGKRYGLAGRMILNYDLTFLAMVLSDGAGRAECRALRDPSGEGLPLCGGRSGAEHGGGHERDTDLLAAAGRRGRPRLLGRIEIPGGLGRFWAGRTARRGRRCRGFDRGARQQLDELSALERESCPTLDEPADAFARLLALCGGGDRGGKAPPGDWSRCCIIWDGGST